MSTSTILTIDLVNYLAHKFKISKGSWTLQMKRNLVSNHNSGKISNLSPPRGSIPWLSIKIAISQTGHLIREKNYDFLYFLILIFFS